jgi:hypothetical protein
MAYDKLGAIRDEHPELQDQPFPADARTVSRWKKRFPIDHPAEADRAIFRNYRWPDAHVTGMLPWEAAEIGLAIKRIMAPRVPTVRHIRWAHRLKVAAPDMPLFIPIRSGDEGNMWCINTVAITLAAHEVANGVGVFYAPSVPEAEQLTYAEVVEDMLIAAPWQDQQEARRYLALNKTRQRGPIGLVMWPGFAAPPAAMAELGFSQEEIAKALAHKAMLFHSTVAEFQVHMPKTLKESDDD